MDKQMRPFIHDGFYLEPFLKYIEAATRPQLADIQGHLDEAFESLPPPKMTPLPTNHQTVGDLDIPYVDNL